MARGRGGFGGGRRPVCLTGVLTGGERDELAALLSAITDVVAMNMDAIYSVNGVLRPTARARAEPSSHKENLPPRQISNGRLTLVAPAGQSGSNHGSFPSGDDDENLILNELRKEMLSFFRKWQVALVNRSRDLETVDPLPEPEEEAPQPSRRNRGRGGRTNARGARNTVPKPPPVGSRTVDIGSMPIRPPSIQQTDPNLRRFQPISTPLWYLPVERRRLLQNVALLIILSLEDYSAYGRIVLMYLASSLNLPICSVQEDEVRIGRCLSKISLDFAEGEMARRIEEGAEMPRSRQTGPNRANDTEFLVGPISQSTLGRCMDGAVLEGTTAMELLGQLGDNGVAMGSLFAFYGAKATGKTMDAYAKDVQDFGLLPIHSRKNKNEPLMDTRNLHPHDRRLRMCICINGSILGKDDQVQDPWQSLGNQAEVYTLRWETNSLRSLGSSIEMVVNSHGWLETKKYFKKHNILDAFTKSKWPPYLERFGKILDNPWTVGMVRADKVGLVLADTIQRKVQGGRPISLVGYGLGARSIYTCLMALAERRQFGLIESVLLIGCPAPSTTHVWVTLKSVVNGRLINAYSRYDYMMPFMYRLCDHQFGLAGIQPIQNCPFVENFEVGELPCGFMRYQFMTGKVMQQVGWEDVDHETVAKEAVKLRELDLKYAPEDIPKPESLTTSKAKAQALTATVVARGKPPLASIVTQQPPPVTIPATTTVKAAPFSSKRGIRSNTTASRANQPVATSLPAKPPVKPTVTQAVAAAVTNQGPLKPVRASALNERRSPAKGRSDSPVPITITTNSPMLPPTSRRSHETIGSSRDRSNSSVSNNSMMSYMTNCSTVPMDSSGGSTSTSSAWSSSGGENLNGGNGGRGKRGGASRRSRADGRGFQEPREYERPSHPGWDALRRPALPYRAYTTSSTKSRGNRHNGGCRYGAIGDRDDDGYRWGRVTGGRMRSGVTEVNNSVNVGSSRRDGPERFDSEYGRERRSGRRGQRRSGNGAASRPVPAQN